MTPTLSKDQLLTRAIECLSFGLQPVPAKDKHPVGTWAQYQSIMLQEANLRELFKVDATGMGFICGKVSGGLEIIDIDCKYDLTGSLFDDLSAAIENALPEVHKKLVVVKTPSGGYHLYYRCDTIERSKKLARRPPSPSELEKDPKTGPQVLIETRGEGGFIMAPPSSGYDLIRGVLDNIPRISPEERSVLMAVCASFNEEPLPQPVQSVAPKKNKDFDTSGGITPFEDYNQRGDVVDLLVAHGWSIVFRRGVRVHLKRPGSSDSKTSGNFHEDLRKFYVFSSSTEFIPEQGYSAVDVYLLLEAGGDKSLASKKLLQLGYGTPFEKKGSAPTQVKIEKASISSVNEDGELLPLTDEAGNLSAEAVKEANAEAVYIDYSAGDSPREVLRALDLIEAATPSNIYLRDRENPAVLVRPYEYRIQRLFDRYRDIHQEKGEVDPLSEDKFLQAVVNEAARIKDPFDLSRYYALFEAFTQLNSLGITKESLKQKADELREKQDLERQSEEVVNLINNAKSKIKTGDAKTAINDLTKGLDKISGAVSVNDFTELFEVTSESDLAARLKLKPDDLSTGYMVGGEEMLLPAGAISIIAAPTSHGKTTLLTNLSLRVAERHPKKSVYLLSYEEDGDSVLISAMNTFIAARLSTNNRKSIRSFYRDESNEYTKRDMRDAFDEGRERFFSEMVNTRRLNIHYVSYDSDTLCKAIRALYKNGNAAAVFVDYMQLLHKGQQGNNKYHSRQEEIKQICIDLKDVAVETGLPIVLGAQFNREVVNPARMHPTKIGEAGDIERIANLILGFWNNNLKMLAGEDECIGLGAYRPDRDHIYIELLKYRGGKPGLAEMLTFDGNTGVISNRTFLSTIQQNPAAALPVNDNLFG